MGTARKRITDDEAQRARQVIENATEDPETGELDDPEAFIAADDVLAEYESQREADEDAWCGNVWVALFTCSENTDSDDPMFWEEGGVYAIDKPTNSAFQASRPFQPDEHIAVCPRCGQRFAATERCTAEENRDLHFNGDEDIPSICLGMPKRDA